MTKWVRPGNCFHCYGRIWKLTVFTVLEESGNSLFSLLWKNLEARHCFDCFGRIWKHTVFTVLFWKNLEAHCFHCTVLEESGSSLFSLFWKNLEAHCFRCYVFLMSKQCKTVSFQMTKTVQNSENSELPDASTQRCLGVSFSSERRQTGWRRHQSDTSYKDRVLLTKQWASRFFYIEKTVSWSQSLLLF